MDSEEAHNHRLKIGDLVLDPGTHQVFRDDQVLDIPKLSYRLLLALVDAAPNVLSQDQLMEAVWPGRIVSPETVTQRVKLLREAIGDHAQAPTYIGLVRGEGYRMLAAVAPLDPPAEEMATGLLGELKRRRVLQVALVYAAIAWSITEVLSFLVEALPVFPAGSKALVAILFVVGFPVAMFLAWRFDIGPGGIVRTEAGTRRDQLTVAAALLLLVGATGGLFYLIYPKVISQTQTVSDSVFSETSPYSVAVLPFENDTGDPDNDFLAKGMSVGLREQLGRTPGLEVAARVSSKLAVTRGMDAEEIATRLGVRYLIEGFVSPAEEGVQVTVAIVQNGKRIGGDTFVRAEENTLSIQDRIAFTVVDTVALDEADVFAASPAGTRSTDAHKEMLRGHAYFQQVRDQQVVDSELLDLAITHYRKATQLDRDSALAHSWLAEALIFGKDLEGAKIPLLKAQRLDPDASNVQNALGLFNQAKGVDKAGDHFRRAVELNRNNENAQASLAWWVWHQGDNQEPEDLYRRALSLDRMSIFRYADLGNFLGMIGHKDKALAVAQEIEQRFSDIPSYQLLAFINELVGETDKAIAWALQASELEPDNEDITAQIAELYARIGDFETALAFEPEPGLGLLYTMRRYEELIDLGEIVMIDDPGDYRARYLLAFGYHVSGRHEHAYDLLRRSGLPHTALSDTRIAPSTEALVTLADAAFAAGNEQQARDWAQFLLNFMDTHMDTGNDDWWPHAYKACALAILGHETEVLPTFRGVVDSPRLPWLPFLKDAPCLQPYANEPEYLEVIQAIESRQSEILKRLPTTLEQHRQQLLQ